MGDFDIASRQMLQAVADALVCPKCQQSNRPGLSPIEFDSHLMAANCSTCGHAWSVKPAAA